MKPRASQAADLDRTAVTLLHPGAAVPTPAAVPAGLPRDLFEQSRGRLRLLAGFFVAAFGFDLVLFAGRWLYGVLTHHTLPDVDRNVGFQWVNSAAAAASAALFWAARSPRISASSLHTLGLVYEIAVCFVSALLSFWQYFLDTGLIPNLTWVPAIVIMFPLILPGPPRRMLGAAVVAAATAPLALLLLDLTGKVVTRDGSGYAPAIVGSMFAVGFAYLGARVIYGLGREVAKARALGSYQLEARLGEGGMGEVWRAQHRLLARPAAIKLIRPALAASADAARSRQAVERFEREAQAIATLRSPHTVELFDFGIADDGAFYYAMELLDGIDADALVRRYGPVPAERVVHILQQVCHSLSEAASRGLVHRDIKPANIFLCRYGEDYDFVKVLDFGIVKTLRDADEGPVTLTAGGAIQGTPAFIAPEQALGETEVDGRADLYALGCVAYWLLTGQLVFRAATPAALLLMHVQTAPQPPSSRTELPVPAALDRIVMDCLAKNPADRPSSARELARRLAATGLAEDWTEDRRRAWWEKHQPEYARPAS